MHLYESRQLAQYLLNSRLKSFSNNQKGGMHENLARQLVYQSQSIRLNVGGRVQK